VLDAEIAGEGERVITSDGDVVTFQAPPAKPVTPDWSQIKSIKRYFVPRPHRTWPAWLYHPTEAPRLLKDEHAAAELGICYREASNEEKGKYGVKAVWDWKDDCLWRPQPYTVVAFDASHPGQGKIYVPTPKNPDIARNEMVEAIIPAVAAAVAKALQANGPASPTNVDPTQWNAFLEFQAWQKTKEVVEAVASEIEPDAAAGLEPSNALVVDEEPEDETANALSPEEERVLWEIEAGRKGVKTDKRWGLDRLKAEVQKAA
jgi:hypothetical protein